MLSASARKTWHSSSASLYMRSRGITCSASSSRPGFSYLSGVVESVTRRLRNCCSRSLAAGGRGTIGRLRKEEYDGGVSGSLAREDEEAAAEPAHLVEGKAGRSSWQGDDGWIEAGSLVWAHKLPEEVASIDGDLRRVRASANSSKRRVRSSCSNRKRKSWAHSSPNLSSEAVGILG